MTAYGKLVRDGIPDLIRREGFTPRVRVLPDAAYREALREKLWEEVAEYLESGELMELADILEVVYALAEADGHDRAALLRAYTEKHEARGGFAGRYYLIAKE